MEDLKYLIEELRELRRELKRVFEKMDSLNDSSCRQDERLKVIEKRQDGYKALFYVTPLSIIIGLVLTQAFNTFLANFFSNNIP